MKTQESNSENPFQSPVGIEDSSRFSLRGFWKAAAGAVGMSCAAFLLHPVVGIAVIIVSGSALARTYVLLDSRHRANATHPKSAYHLFGASFLLMTLLIFSSVMASLLTGGSVAFFADLILPALLNDPTGVGSSTVLLTLAGGLAGGGLLFGYGFWALLP